MRCVVTSFLILYAMVHCHVELPSDIEVLESTVCRAVCGKLWSFIDDLTDARLADEVGTSSGRVSVWNVVIYETTEINFGLLLMFAKKIQ